MSPVLRGEALPLPAREIATLRADLPRDYADAVVPTASGPYLVIRVPHREPDFLRDLEAAVDVLPYRDLKGFRGVLLVGDRAHMGVSTDMLRALVEGRAQSEREWLATRRRQMDPWTFAITRMPSDPQRRLRAVFRVDTESVEDLDDPHFDRLAEMLPAVKAASPGQTRPGTAYLVSACDHVTVDGAAFFSELERRVRRNESRQERLQKKELDDRHDLAIAHLERILRERGETLPERSPAPAPAPRPTLPPVDVVRAAPERAPPTPERPDPFRAASRHPEALDLLRRSLTEAGYKVKERLVVRDQPIVLAGARIDGYPTRVLVAFFETIGPDAAQRLLLTGRGVGAELILCIADQVEEGTDRVTLATNLKVIPPDAVPDLRFR